MPDLPIADADHASGKWGHIYKRIRKGTKAKRTPMIFQACRMKPERLQAVIPMAM